MPRSGFAVFALAATLAAQAPTPSSPVFDVVSIHVEPPNAPPAMREQDFTPVLQGARYMDSRASMISMVAFAWNVKNPPIQLTGLPGWTERTSFAVSARAGADFPVLPPAENIGQVRLMMRAMLADRFHLQLHTEIRQQKILKFEVARGGMKFKEADPPVPPAKEGNVFVVGANNGGGRMIGNKSTMPGLARVLPLVMNQPVIDETGLRNYYDFDVRWNGDGSQPASGPPKSSRR